MTTTTTTSGTRHARRADLPAAAAVLADAFATDPWFGWLYPDRGDWPAFPSAWFALVLERAFPAGHTYVADGGVADWIPPDVEFPQEADIALAVALLGEHIGSRATDAFGVIGAAGAAIPHEPRFHCVYVGVRPDRQGQGTGSALLRRILDTCDREGLPASLTSTNDVNLPWYRSLGFEEITAVPVPGADFCLRPMWRSPAA